MNEAPKPAAVPVGAPEAPPVSAAVVLRRIQLITLSLLFFVLVLYLLEKFEAILQPLLIAFFIVYLILPFHEMLVDRGIPSILAYILILAMILGALFGCGVLVYRTAEQMVTRLPDYQEILEHRVRKVLISFEVPNAAEWTLDELGLFDAERVRGAARAIIGTFKGLLTGLGVTFIYLLFIIAERESIQHRLIRAFGEKRGQHLLSMAASINRSISQYLGVKTFTGLVAALLSMLVLAGFGVDFYILWGFLIFLFNYIPYIGSLVAIGLPIALSFLMLDVASAIMVAVLLVAIQQVLGTFLEPRMAGRRLQVSPLLILLSLSFWGILWGITGMILAVPLLVVIKSIFDNIPETRPIATLMANE
jgi:AI-2 transport protein TqsA